jgi:integrase
VCGLVGWYTEPMRQINRLSALQVKTAKRDVCDGFGLWLQYDKKYGTRSWLFRYMLNGKADSMGLGPLATTSLARARELAQDAREQLRDGINPRLARKAERDRRKAEAERLAAIPSFLKCADLLIAAKASEWSNLEHAAQWRRSFHPGSHGEPAPTARINPLPVNAIDTPLVLATLEPLWKKTPVTAGRIRARIENVLDFAKAHGWRDGDNPAALAITQHAMPRLTNGSRAHLAALPYADIPSFMAALRAKPGLAARRLEFTILTAARRDEALGARWDEVDLEARLWTVPANRMKARTAHVVPLSDRAIEILNDLPRVGPFLFPGVRVGQPMGEKPGRVLLESMRPGITLHGFRSSFRDWCGDVADAPREIAEAALAHRIGNAVEQSYRRGSALEKRRALMEAWSDYCGGRS